jgi:ADP-heptose:LPS heptosyltransferase
MSDLDAPIPQSASEVVVVFRTDKIGDLIVTSPLFRAIKASRPAAYVILVCSPYNRAVLENMPEIDRIVTLDEKARFRDKLTFALALRRLKPAVVFAMSPGLEGAWMAWLARAKRRVGVVMSYRHLQRLTAPLLLTETEIIDRKRLDRGTDHSLHLSEVALRLAERCGFKRPADVALSVPTSAANRAWAAGVARGAAWPERRIVLHLGVNWRVCGMPEAALMTLTAHIEAAFPDFTLLLTAGPAEHAILARLQPEFSEIVSQTPLVLAAPRLHPRALLFAGLSFGAWSALIETASLVVTPDTGAVHLASAHQIPVVAVYVASRFNAATSLFGPWETRYRTLRGRADGEAEALLGEIVAAMGELLA